MESRNENEIKFKRADERRRLLIFGDQHLSTVAIRCLRKESLVESLVKILAEEFSGEFNREV